MKTLQNIMARFVENSMQTSLLFHSLTCLIQTRVDEIRKVIIEANLGGSNFETETLAYSIYSL